MSDEAAVEAGYRNVRYCYGRLSTLSARGRRDGSFPDLSESVRSLTRVPFFEDADDLREHIRKIARLDRMEGQERSILVAVEKDGMRGFLHDWFNEYGLLVTSLNGYPSQTLVDKIRRWRRADKRPMVVLYAGDHDATGEDIDRDFPSRLGEGIEVRRVALLPEHIERYGLPRSFDVKEDDARNASFQARHGGLWQTELDALDPDILRDLYMAEFEPMWDMSQFEERKDAEHELLEEVLGEAA